MRTIDHPVTILWSVVSLTASGSFRSASPDSFRRSTTQNIIHKHPLRPTQSTLGERLNFFHRRASPFQIRCVYSSTTPHIERPMLTKILNTAAFIAIIYGAVLLRLWIGANA